MRYRGGGERLGPCRIRMSLGLLVDLIFLVYSLCLYIVLVRVGLSLLFWVWVYMEGYGIVNMVGCIFFMMLLNV